MKRHRSTVRSVSGSAVSEKVLYVSSKRGYEGFHEACEWARRKGLHAGETLICLESWEPPGRAWWVAWLDEGKGSK